MLGASWDVRRVTLLMERGRMATSVRRRKAGEMEVEAALILFRRSLEQHNLLYTTVLCDGDSRSYLAFQDDEVYRYIPIEKEDCVNQVQKRMGTALRNLVAKHRGPGHDSLGGKGRLTADLISTETHKDADATQRAVMATYHITSNDNVANSTFCPPGPNSWCKQNAAVAKGDPVPKHPRKPLDVCQALLPIYECLSDKKLLQRCQREKTQNNNESLHSMTWALASKDRHSSLFTVEAAVAEAVLKFNAGNARASGYIMKELCLNRSQQSHSHMSEKDRRLMAASAKKRRATENFR